MESNTVGFSKRLNYPSQKRKLAPESNSTNGEDLQLLGNDSSQHLRQLESKNRELEARIDSMYTQFNTMVSLNQELESQVHNLQQQYRELKSRINGFEHRSPHIASVSPDVRRQSYDPGQYSRETKPNKPDIDQLTEDFEERFDLVESNNQELTERLDSCQQNFAKMSVKTKSFENELVNLQQRLNNFEMHDTDMQHTETIPTQQLAEGDTYQNSSTTVKTKFTDDMNTTKGTVIYPSNHTKKWVHLFLL